MSSTAKPIVGYSVNDFYYENPKYCIKDSINPKLYIPNGNPENECTIDGNPADCPCTLNEHYGKIVKAKQTKSAAETYKYTTSVEEYNTQILRTVNYLVGVGMISAFLISTLG